MNLPPPDFQSDPLPPSKPSAFAEAPIVNADAVPPSAVASAPHRAVAQKPLKMEDVDHESWLAIIKDALIYPWRDHGWMILVPGGLMALVSSISSFGILGLLSLTLIGGYFTAHYFNVIETTISGKMSQPEWPEISDVWGEVVGPALQVFVVSFIAIAPALMLDWIAEQKEWPEAFELVLSAVGLAAHCLYFPLAMVAVALHGTVFAGFPHRVFPALVRCSPGYGVGAFCLWLVSLLLPWFVSLLFEVPFVGWLLGFSALVYFLVIHGRFCGLLYRRFEERIGW